MRDGRRLTDWGRRAGGEFGPPAEDKKEKGYLKEAIGKGKKGGEETVVCSFPSYFLQS